MEPSIQYAKTRDGVNIAFYTLGRGRPLIHMPHIVSHLQMEWEYPECRQWYERLAEHRMLVRYDHRGLGLSDRERTDYSLEAVTMDFEAVMERLELESVDLMGLSFAGPAAIRYAARHPERVSHLVLWGTYAHAPEWAAVPATEASRALQDKDWVTYTEVLAHTVIGWSAGEPAHRFAEMIRGASTPEVFQAAIRAGADFDVRPLLTAIRSPTLVLHRRHIPLPVDVARRLASQIPDARLALLEGDSPAPYLGDTEAALTAIEEFLSDGDEAPEAAGDASFRTILFTDIEGSTAITQRLGDAAAQDLVRAHNTLVRDAIKACRGTEIKNTGDGMMASFPSASRALECAIAIQRALLEHETTPLRVRIGVNAGEPVAEERDLFGTAVQLARRVCDRAEGGQILVSDVVRQLVSGKGFLFADTGEVALKGFEDPVRLYEVRWREDP